MVFPKMHRAGDPSSDPSDYLTGGIPDLAGHLLLTRLEVRKSKQVTWPGAKNLVRAGVVGSPSMRVCPEQICASCYLAAKCSLVRALRASSV